MKMQQEVQGGAGCKTHRFAKYKKIIGGIAAAAVIIVLIVLFAVNTVDRERILRKSCFAIGVRWKGKDSYILCVLDFSEKKWNTGWKQDMHGWIPLWQLMIIKVISEIKLRFYVMGMIETFSIEFNDERQ